MGGLRWKGLEGEGRTCSRRSLATFSKCSRSQVRRSTFRAPVGGPLLVGGSAMLCMEGKDRAWGWSGGRPQWVFRRRAARCKQGRACWLCGDARVCECVGCGGGWWVAACNDAGLAKAAERSLPRRQRSFDVPSFLPIRPHVTLHVHAHTPHSSRSSSTIDASRSPPPPALLPLHTQYTAANPSAHHPHHLRVTASHDHHAPPRHHHHRPHVPRPPAPFLPSSPSPPVVLARGRHPTAGPGRDPAGVL